MKISICDFNKKFGNKAEIKDIGMFFVTDGNAIIPLSFWSFKDFKSYNEAFKYNCSINNKDGVIYEIIEEVTK